VHSDDELPFNPATVPPQPTMTGATVIPQAPGSTISTIVVTPAENVPTQSALGAGAAPVK
jgi:hypothetical protein